MPSFAVPTTVSSADELLEIARSAVDRDAQVLIDSEHEITCRAGCSVCCNQAVPVTAAEVRAIRDHLDAQDSERREVMDERIRLTAARLAQAGVDGDVPPPGDPERAGFVARYFEASVPCPMLEPGGTCGVRPVRPLACREYLVASDPVHCARLDSPQVVRLRARRDVLVGFHHVSTALGEPDIGVLALALAGEVEAAPEHDSLSGPGLFRLLTMQPLAQAD